jgi:hypothetical protein
MSKQKQQYRKMIMVKKNKLNLAKENGKEILIVSKRTLPWNAKNEIQLYQKQISNDILTMV